MTNQPVVRETAKPDIEYERLLAEEALILDSTELISELMHEKGLTRAELAKLIGKTRAFVTQVLAGNRNMTLRTLADLAFALDARVNVVAQPLKSVNGQSAGAAMRGRSGPRKSAADLVINERRRRLRRVARPLDRPLISGQ
jgi:transcriptional regulator with XRE-family HTH domain